MISVIVLLFSLSTEANFCVQGLVSQFDKKLLEAYPKTPGLCSATCIGNLLYLIHDKLAPKSADNVLKVIDLIKKTNQNFAPYQPNKEGLSFNQTIKALSELAKRKGSKIKKIEAKTYAALTAEDRAMLKEESHRVSFSNQRTLPIDIRKSSGSWMILGLSGWLGRNNYTDYSHDVLGRWDESVRQLVLIDPANPKEPSRWEFVNGAGNFPARLKRVSGPFYRGFALVGVDEWIKILTKN